MNSQFRPAQPIQFGDNVGQSAFVAAAAQAQIDTVTEAAAYIGNALANETSIDDDNDNQNHVASCGFGNNSAAYVGWDFGAGNEKVATGMRIVGSNNRGINENNSGSQTCHLRGSNSAPTSRTDGTSLLSIVISVANATNIDVQDLTSSNTTAYRYVWWDSGATSSGSAQLCELDVWEN